MPKNDRSPDTSDWNIDGLLKATWYQPFSLGLHGLVDMATPPDII
jgi:hypothetical protein